MATNAPAESGAAPVAPSTDVAAFGCGSVLDGVLEGVAQSINQITRDMPKVLLHIAGIQGRERMFTGKVSIENSLEQDAQITFWKGSLLGCKASMLHTEKVAGGATFEFEGEESCDFDYIVVAQELPATFMSKKEVRAQVIRNGKYRLTSRSADADPAKVPSNQGLAIETVEQPPRRKTELLATCPGLSFSFSASGWLFVYQLGVAECLQNNGILTNSDVRVSGASGGSLTGTTMMYGCDMPSLKQIIKASAHKVHCDLAEGANLRTFVLEAARSVVKDGSYLHPCIQNEKLYIAYSQTEAQNSLALAAITRDGIEEHRAHRFKDSAEVVTSMLASSSMGISGLPFQMTNDEGKEVMVADGGFCDLLPALDEHSVKVKPWTDGGILAGRPEIMPTEFVPGHFGLYPAALESLDHLYELGYQDMQEWLDQHLAERVDQIRRAAADSGEALPEAVPPTPAFTCEDNGLLWYEKVKRHVPTDWKDMLDDQGTFERRAAKKVVREGLVEVDVMAFALQGSAPALRNRSRSSIASEPSEGEAGADAAAPTAPLLVRLPTLVRKELHCRVTGDEIWWNRTPELEEGKPPDGRIPLVWVESLELGMDAACVFVNTVDARQVKITAKSLEEAAEWEKCIHFALEESRQARSKLQKALEGP